MKLTEAHFKKIFPKADAELVEALNPVLAYREINTVRRAAAFLAQLGHESLDLTRFVENLNYSADGLANTWPGRYALKDGQGGYVKVGINGRLRNAPNALAERLARNPQAIANNCYADRMGNGNEASGDGWKYRGRGGFMATGKDQYLAIGVALSLPLIEKPEILEFPQYALESSGLYWSRYALNARADKGNFKGITQHINGGQIGAADRQTRYERLLDYLGKIA